MEKIKVLHIGLSTKVAGIETVVHSWLKYKPEWVQFDFINVHDEPLAFEDDFKKAGGEVFRICRRSKNPVISFLQLRSIIRNGEYNFVHDHISSFSGPEPCVIVNRMKSKTQIILHSHTALVDGFTLKYKLLDKMGRLRLVGAKYLRLACGIDAGEKMFRGESFHLIKNGVDFKRSAFSEKHRNLIRSKLKVKKEEILIGHVGRSCYEKNYPFILDCFAALAANNCNLRLLLIGDILDDQSIQSRIDALGIREKVICTGKVMGTYLYYSAMDVYFMPSIVEGVSLALLEAQVSGLPCVASETIAKESKISNQLEFASITDMTKVCAAIQRAIEQIRTNERANVDLDESYREEFTAKQMFDFYQTHLLKREASS